MIRCGLILKPFMFLAQTAFVWVWKNSFTSSAPRDGQKTWKSFRSCRRSTQWQDAESAFTSP